MKKIILILGIALLFLILFKTVESDFPEYNPNRSYVDLEEEILEAFILAKDSTTIELPEGHFLFSQALSIDGKKHITIKGKGMDKTILSFKGQTKGAEGILVTNCANFTIENLSIEDAAGDYLKISKYKKQFSKEYRELNRRIKGINTDIALVKLSELMNRPHKPMATRKSSQVVMSEFGNLVPELIGGSADLKGSNLSYYDEMKVFSDENPSGKYIYYGVREFGMSAISNGIFLHGALRPFASTFLIFSEYAKNAIRMSALMKLPIVYIFTHDSIGLGEDGPTHQYDANLIQTANGPQSPQVPCSSLLRYQPKSFVPCSSLDV